MSDAIDALIKSAEDAVRAKDLVLARACYTEAADATRAAGDEARLAYVLRHLSDIVRNDDALEALTHAEEAQRIYRARPDGLGLANSIRLVALAHTALSQKEHALAAWRDAGVLYAQAGVEAGVNECERRVQALTGSWDT